jgi:hypothetical protein
MPAKRGVRPDKSASPWAALLAVGGITGDDDSVGLGEGEEEVGVVEKEEDGDEGGEVVVVVEGEELIDSEPDEATGRKSRPKFNRSAGSSGSWSC